VPPEDPPHPPELLGTDRTDGGVDRGIVDAEGREVEGLRDIPPEVMPPEMD